MYLATTGSTTNTTRQRKRRAGRRSGYLLAMSGFVLLAAGLYAVPWKPVEVAVEYWVVLGLPELIAK